MKRPLMRRFAVVLALFAPAWAAAQAPAALPARIDAAVGLPGAGPERFLNVAVVMDGRPWYLEGCVASARGTCRATQRVELDDAGRAALVRHIGAIRGMPRCEPEGFAPGDPEYRIEMNGTTYLGRLLRDRWPAEARDGGPCGAPSQLAAWLVRTFGARR